MKSPWISLRIDWILKIMVQFCYLRLYLGIVTVSCHLLQRMARMEMDWDLKQLGQLFRVLMPFLQNSPPKISCFIPPDEICLITFFTTLQENQVPVGVVFTQAPYYSPHCFQQKTKNQNKTKKQTKTIYFHFVVCWVHYEGERISGPSLLLDLVPRSLLFPSRWSIPWERGCSTARKSSFSTGFIVTIPLFFLNAREYIIWQNSFLGDSGAHKYALLWITGFNC